MKIYIFIYISLYPPLVLQAPHCEHAFCNACITQWFAQQQICPVDRTVVTLAHLRPVPRIMRNMLSKLQISCDNASFGCTATLRLDQLQSHLKDCEHNPKRPVNCEEGCGSVVKLFPLHDHSSVCLWGGCLIICSSSQAGDAQGRAAQPQLHQTPEECCPAAADQGLRPGENSGRT